MLVVAEREQLSVTQAKAGEPEAWSVLFRRFQLPLYVYVFELARDELPYDEEFLLAALLHDVGKAIDPRDYVGAAVEALEDAAPTAAPRTEVLLEEIRDLLKKRS